MATAASATSDRSCHADFLVILKPPEVVLLGLRSRGSGAVRGRSLSPEHATLPEFPDWGLAILAAAENVREYLASCQWFFRKLLDIKVKDLSWHFLLQM